MRCTDVIAKLKNYSNGKIDDGALKEFLAHLRNGKYCRSDSETFLKENEAGDANHSEICSQMSQSVSAVIRESKHAAMPERIFSLIEVKPVLIGCVDELGEAFREFA